MKRAKGTEEQWRRLGREVKVLSRLIQKILCDREYQSFTTKALMAHLARAERAMDRYRCDTEDRMMSTTACRDTSVFYGTAAEDIEQSAEQAREIMQASAPRAPIDFLERRVFELKNERDALYEIVKDLAKSYDTCASMSGCLLGRERPDYCAGCHHWVWSGFSTDWGAGGAT